MSSSKFSLRIGLPRLSTKLERNWTSVASRRIAAGLMRVTFASNGSACVQSVSRAKTSCRHVKTHQDHIHCVTKGVKVDELFNFCR